MNLKVWDGDDLMEPRLRGRIAHQEPCEKGEGKADKGYVKVVFHFPPLSAGGGRLHIFRFLQRPPRTYVNRDTGTGKRLPSFNP